jgi:hypothetical protein
MADTGQRCLSMGRQTRLVVAIPTQYPYSKHSRKDGLSDFPVSDCSLCYVALEFPGRLETSTLWRVGPVDHVLGSTLFDDAPDLIVLFGINKTVRISDDVFWIALT